MTENDNILNISTIICNQLVTLINQIKDAISSQKSELSVNINIQIYSIKIIEDKKNDKKLLSMILNDNLYKLNGFILVDNEQSGILKSGHIINIKKIVPKKIKSNLFIMIKEFSIINNQSNTLPNKLKLIKENNNTFIDEAGNQIEEELSYENVLTVINELNNDKKNYTSLKELTTFSRNFIIFVRIIKKSEIKTFETRNVNHSNILTGLGKLFYFVVLDRDGNEMQCTCFNKTVDKFYNLIEEDNIYEIKGGYVKINDKKYTRIKADYKIVLDENSTIIKKNDDNSIIKKINYNFIPISDLSKSKIYSIVDICAIVLETTDLVIKTTKNGKQPLKKIVLGDISKYKIELSLWRSLSDLKIKKNDLLIINNVKVGEYKGRNLSTFEETSIKINPPLNLHPAIKKLKDFLNLNNLNIEDYISFEDLYKERLQKYKEMNEKYFRAIHIRDVLEYLDELEEQKMLFKINATVTQIIHNEKNYYIGCIEKNCKRKLIYDINKNEYTCPGCNKKTKIPTYYYTLSLRVKDASSEYWIDIFGKTAESVTKCSAEEYKEFIKKKDMKKLKEISDFVEFKKFSFWIKPKLQFYNNITKKKLYTYRIEVLDEKSESRKIIEYLKKELKI